MTPRENVELADHTTLGVGGPARWWYEAENEVAIRKVLAWADSRDAAVEILGGGSNALVADRGLPGLVVRVRDDALEDDDGVVDVGAGMSWDAFVAWSVATGYAGIECMSGIPGDVGAAPMQNVGAYGQEVATTIVHVRAIDRTTGSACVIENGDCAFAYRDSMFKSVAKDRYIITGVRFRLNKGGAPTLAYPELQRAAGDAPTLASVRETVIALRRRKSMVLDPADENRRSAGSFFVNPTVAPADADRVDDLIAEPMPRYPAGDRVKLSAAWLIERAGFAKGTRRGNVGISTKHSLAIVNKGGATAAELVAFAAEVRAAVGDRFGVTLHPEPRPLGFEASELAALYSSTTMSAHSK